MGPLLPKLPESFFGTGVNGLVVIRWEGLQNDDLSANYSYTASIDLEQLKIILEHLVCESQKLEQGSSGQDFWVK